MSKFAYEALRKHVGHSISCVQYGDGVNVSVECEDCQEVIYDQDHPDCKEEE